MKFRNKVLGVASVVAVAGTVAVAGLTAASASPAARPGVSGIEHVQIMTTSAASNKASIILTGVFTAGGVDIQGAKVDKVVFPHGTFKVAHSRGTGTTHFSPRTCLTVISLHGTYKIGHGTGRYVGISGHGKYQANILIVAARSHGKCSQTKAPVAFQQIIRAHGPVTL